jgi:hypothetical protein
MKDDRIEQLADYAHSTWSGWMEYLFKKSEATPSGSVVIPSGLVQRWKRQMSTPYAELSEEEKGSDRVEAHKILAILEDEE